MSTALEVPLVDFALLADRAEVLGNKLYMMGGGWDQLGVVDFSAPTPLCLALGVLVPWNEANGPHLVNVAIEHEDAGAVTPTYTLSIAVGRPQYARPGQSFRAMAVLNVPVSLPRPGTYVAVVSLAGQDSSPRRVVFNASPVQTFVRVPQPSMSPTGDAPPA